MLLKHPLAECQPNNCLGFVYDLTGFSIYGGESCRNVSREIGERLGEILNSSCFQIYDFFTNQQNIEKYIVIQQRNDVTISTLHFRLKFWQRLSKSVQLFNFAISGSDRKTTNVSYLLSHSKATGMSDYRYQLKSIISICFK